MSIRLTRAVLAAAALAWPVLALGALPEAALRACRAIADDDERLACYDRALDGEAPQAPAATARAEPQPSAAPVAAAKPALTPEEAFGREAVMDPEEQRKRKEEPRQLEELRATVVSISRRREDGLMTITLDNGQVWRQNRPDSLFRLREGDPIRIQPGALRSYILSGPDKRSTRVSRIK